MTATSRAMSFSPQPGIAFAHGASGCDLHTRLSMSSARCSASVRGSSASYRCGRASPYLRSAAAIRLPVMILISWRSSSVAASTRRTVRSTGALDTTGSSRGRGAARGRTRNCCPAATSTWPARSRGCRRRLAERARRQAARANLQLLRSGSGHYMARAAHRTDLRRSCGRSRQGFRLGGRRKLGPEPREHRGTLVPHHRCDLAAPLRPAQHADRERLVPRGAPVEILRRDLAGRLPGRCAVGGGDPEADQLHLRLGELLARPERDLEPAATLAELLP